jgi:hypothetical protein
MTRFLDAALRFGFGVLLACAGLSAAGASADAPRAPEVLDVSAGIVRSDPSAPAALALVRAGLVRFEARPSVPPAALPAPAFALPALAFSSVPAAPAAVRRPGSAPGSLSRGPPAASA